MCRLFICSLAVTWVCAVGCGGGSLKVADGGPDAGGGAGGGGAGGGGATGFTQTFSQNDRDVDILFMVDNSLSMQPINAQLVAAFPTFTQTLQQSPLGLPNMHIAVVSSDLGAGQFTTIPHCSVGGDGGQFKYQIGTGTTEVGGTLCTSTGLDAGAHFISLENGVANFDTTVGLDRVFACIASLGDSGCGFEHQLASVTRALNADGQGLPPGNDGFLRPSARLAIILVTNEDDCSAPPTAAFFDPNSKSINDPFGPLQSYRCNEFGHLCNGLRPPRTMAATFSEGQCVPAESAGMLIPVSTIVSQIKSLKADPSRILVAALAGPPADPNGQYVVEMVDATTGTADATAGLKWPSVGHSCTQGGGVSADPAIRIKAAVDAFGANGLFLPVCAPSYVGAMQTIAQVLNRDPGCLYAAIPNVDPLAPEVPASCTLTGAGVLVPRCPAAAGTPCFGFSPDASCGPSGLKLNVQVNGGPPVTGTDLTLHCPLAASSG